MKGENVFIALIAVLPLLVSRADFEKDSPSPESSSNPPVRVVKATLRAFPMEYNGHCPVQIKFKAKISTVGGKGAVNCQIVRSDGLPAPSISIQFSESGTRDTTYILNQSESFSGWHQLKIVSPNEIHSNKVELTLLCM